MNPEKRSALDAIARNIERYGYHMYVVNGGCLPRFAYSIGLSRVLGSELVLPGGLYYKSLEDVSAIFKQARFVLENRESARRWDVLELGELGDFEFRQVHTSWVRGLMLGALDYYSVDTIRAYQLSPRGVRRTIDVPDMSVIWSVSSAPV